MRRAAALNTMWNTTASGCCNLLIYIHLGGMYGSMGGSLRAEILVQEEERIKSKLSHEFGQSFGLWNEGQRINGTYLRLFKKPRSDHIVGLGLTPGCVLLSHVMTFVIVRDWRKSWTNTKENVISCEPRKVICIVLDTWVIILLRPFCQLQLFAYQS